MKPPKQYHDILAIELQNMIAGTEIPLINLSYGRTGGHLRRIWKSY